MKKILIIDIDDVLVDSYMFIKLNKFLGTNYKEEDFSDYYLEDAIKDPKRLDEYYKFIFTQDMYKDISIKAGVQEVLPKLNKKYDLLLCTDFLIPNYEWQADKEFVSKFNMLREKFPYLNPKQFIFMRRKQLLNGDIILMIKLRILVKILVKNCFSPLIIIKELMILNFQTKKLRE